MLERWRNWKREVLINSIDKDGFMQDHDIDFLKTVVKSVNCQIIAAVGAVTFQYLKDVFKLSGGGAASCVSLFYLDDNNPICARSYLRNECIPVGSLRKRL